MGFRLGVHRYGKARVRVMRVDRGAARHEVDELDLHIMLEGGAFAPSYDRADNASIVATDTMKNLAYVVAAEAGPVSSLAYVEALAGRLLGLYAHVETVVVEARETQWRRMAFAGDPHPHAFVREGNGRPFLAIRRARDGRAEETIGGIDDRQVLKSTGSGFAAFYRDAFTTLPDTDDRIFATAIRGRWTYAEGPPDDADADRAAVLAAFDDVFANSYSVSVQETLYRMGGAALAAVPALARVELVLPNLHYLPTDLSRFGIADSSAVLVPSAEPHGQIEAVIERDGP